MGDSTLGPGALDGVRVLDLSGPIGAYCTRLLADLGADVVLVEPPDGDPLRRIPPFRGDDPNASLAFAYYHASKRTIVIDDGDRARSPDWARTPTSSWCHRRHARRSRVGIPPR